MIATEAQPSIITIIGPEGSGKTTQRNRLAKRLGGVVMQVEAWPALERFLSDPAKYAFDNQTQAMQYTVKALDAAKASGQSPIVADLCPDRVHLVHSWLMKQDGLITDQQWSELQDQYDTAAAMWGRQYVYLKVSLPVLLERLNARGLPEDLEFNAKTLAATTGRWERVVSDAVWRSDKLLLELDGSQAPAIISHDITNWLSALSLSADDQRAYNTE